ncbi:CLUMA_CG013471, isoform A [Clunio marinus]|uniref:CLUMA_CG013471, isoform A n=1 Tax=Clunio marinus TaxID=568069 RepID=A0A1J1IIY2_9DIPT|nr:CLUMA_CG013471, isoform A [Clunio marinus]
MSKSVTRVDCFLDYVIHFSRLSNSDPHRIPLSSFSIGEFQTFIYAAISISTMFCICCFVFLKEIELLMSGKITT